MLKKLTIAAAALLGGCTMIPPYQRPASPVAQRFTGDRSNGVANVDQIKWRDVFADPRMRQCIELALLNNRDLRVAALNVERAQAQYQIQRAELYPDVGGYASYSRNRFSGNAINFPGANDSRSRGFTFDDYQLGVGVTSYELDLFGRVRSGNRRAIEQYLSQEQTRRSTQIALVAQVAVQYLTIREYQEQLEFARQTLQSVQNAWELTKRRTDAGTAPESDLALANVQVQTARVKITQYERLLSESNNLLEQLVGQTIPKDQPTTRPTIDEKLLAELPPGLPSDLINRRPDILAAEHTLLAANANIGAVRAAFFPSITLTGSAGLSSSDLTSLFNSSSKVWAFTPQITVPIFAGGRDRANLQAAQADRRIGIANYEKAIQIAFREVSDALVARESYVKQLEAQEALVKAQQHRLDLAQARNNNGVADYLNVLTAQQDLYAAQENRITARAAQLKNLVSLYKALGGGWDEPAPATQPIAAKSNP